MFENYKDSLFNDKIIIKSQQRFRIDHHRVYSEEVNKIVLSSNDHKKIQASDKATTYPYGMWKRNISRKKEILIERYY